MDAAQLTQLIASAPNLLIAVWVIYSYQKTIDRLLANQQDLIDKLMAMQKIADEHPAVG